MKECSPEKRKAPVASRGGGYVSNPGKNTTFSAGDRYQQSWKRYRHVKKSLSGNPDLERIVKAASKDKRDELREFVVECLAQAVAFAPTEGTAGNAGAARRRTRRLRSVAQNMRTTAKQAKYLMESDDARMDLLAALAYDKFLTGRVEMSDGWPNTEKFHWCSEKLIEAMNQCAELAAIQASALGHYGRRGVPFERSIPVLILDKRIRRDTNHDFHNELARLLTDAYDAAGANKTFTADQIRKIANRHRPPDPS